MRVGSGLAGIFRADGEIYKLNSGRTVQEDGE